MTATTHEIAIEADRVVKTFRSWDRDEHRREWAGLTLLHECDPGLAPQPLSRREPGGRPAVVMSRIPGTPLGGRPLTPGQVAGVAEAMNRLHTAVPRGGLDRLPSRLWGVADAVKGLRDVYGPSLPGGAEPTTSRAVDEARRWLACDEPDRLARDAGQHRVFAQADGNLGNFLWDGERCRLVDFEDSGLSDRAYEIADLVEHVSVTLTGLLEADDLVDRLDLSPALVHRVRQMRRLYATFWLYMLLPGNRGHHRNPPGSVERQAERTLALLA